MSKLIRYLTTQVQQDLQQKMVWVGGPRQVGKTTLAKHILGPTQQAGYLNWDIPEQREAILQRHWPTTDIWVFDEIHKYRSWRNELKGLYDQYHDTKKILVTGSARLEVYRYGGDSLQGRYHYLRFHPLSVAELKITTQRELTNLLRLGGFPEPFFGGSAAAAKRWSREYRTRLIEEDIRSLEKIIDLGKMELLLLRLPKLVGSPLSLNALSEDLQVSQKTAAHWVNIFEAIYAVFRLSPFGSPMIKAIKKAQKHYHFDWTLVTEPGFRFENMVACHLLKWVQWQQDVLGEDMELRYWRDVEGREVDFVVCQAGQPVYAIECKWKEPTVNPALLYFKKRFPQCEAWQITAQDQRSYETDDGIRVSPALEFLQKLI